MSAVHRGFPPKQMMKTPKSVSFKTLYILSLSELCRLNYDSVLSWGTKTGAAVYLQTVHSKGCVQRQDKRAGKK